MIQNEAEGKATFLPRKKDPVTRRRKKKTPFRFKTHSNSENERTKKLKFLSKEEVQVLRTRKKNLFSSESSKLK